MIHIPDSLIQNVRVTHGQQGDKWLSNLDETINKICQQWNVTLTGEFSNLTYNFVAPVTFIHGGQAVIKVSPHLKGIARQARALESYDGVGAVRLLASNQSEGALLLEMAQAPLHIDTSEFCEIASMLHSVDREIFLKKSFPHISIWGLGFEKFLRTENNESQRAREVGLSDRLVEEADKIFKHLVITSESETLLHGDLHHSNVLQRKNGEFICIDPKGVWGDPCFEVGAFLRNPMPEVLVLKNLNFVIDQRIKTISKELRFDESRIRDWAYAQAILAAIWSVGDGCEQVQRWLKISSYFR